MNIDNVIIYDIETPEYCFLASFYLPEENLFKDFLVNKWQNDLYSMVKFIDQNKDCKSFVGYNNLKFDSQVIEFIIRNHTKWFDLSNTDISKIISKFASNEIDNTNYGLFSTFKESELSFKNLDLPCIWHFFNENRRVSLKQLEFEMRAENIENLEFELNKDFSYEEIYGENGIIDYCHNDVIQTYKHYLFTRGKVDHSLYKGKDKLLDRKIINEEVGLDAWNWDDVKIGAEWNKKDYLELSKKSEKELKPQKVEQFYGKKFKQFFPKTITFIKPELKEFVKKFGETFILNQKQEFKYSFNKELTVTLAKGGIHSNEKNRFIKPNEDEIYLQCDIGSQYPNAINKYFVEPPHLPGWNSLIVSKIERRLGFKSLYKKTKEPKYNSLQEMGKLSLNGGSYGRLNTKGDWQEHPPSMLKVTIGCQLEILMTVEKCLLNNFRVVSVNTDGYDVVIKKSDLNKFFDLCEEIETAIGNIKLGKFEYTVFEWIAQTSVNDYIAKKLGEYADRQFIPHISKNKYDDLKLKGDFEVDKELHKNSSFRILPLAYRAYYYDNIDPETFIKNHKDIFDFCARSNSGSTYYHEGYDKKSSFKLPKLIRYYVSKEGIRVKKIVKENADTNANDTNVQPAEELKTICNRLPKESYERHLINVKREWYINKTKEVILSIIKNKKVKQLDNPNQLTLF